jgi:hypothetical protein
MQLDAKFPFSRRHLSAISDILLDVGVEPGGGV